METRILIVQSRDSEQTNRIKNLFEAGGHQVAIIGSSEMESLNEEFAKLPLNKKFPHVFEILENKQKK